jgi:uncharacterized membrane protein
VALAYLLLPAVHQPNFYDFHFTAVGMLFVNCTLYWLDRLLEEERSRGLARVSTKTLVMLVSFALAAMLSREDTALGLATCGIVVAAWRSPVVGAALFAAAGSYFVFIKFWLMPQFGTMWFAEIYSDLIPEGHSSIVSVLLTLLSNPGYVLGKLIRPEKVVYVLHLAAPLAFLWLRRPSLWFALLPGLPFTLLVTNRAPMYEVSFQYVYHFIPYVFAGSVLALEHLRKQSSLRMVSASMAMAFAVVLSSQQFGALFGQSHVRGGFDDKRLVLTPADRERYAALRELVEKLPPDAFVAASAHVGPHVSTRLDAIQLHMYEDAQPDYLLASYDAQKRQQLALGRALKGREFGVVAESGEFVLLERGASTRGNRAALRHLKKRRD